MPRQFSENEHELDRLVSNVTFCPETGRRLAQVRFDTSNLRNDDNNQNTKAHDEVRSLWEKDPENPCDHRTAAGSVLENIQQRAGGERPSTQPQDVEITENFSALEKRSSDLPVRKVRKPNPDSIDGIEGNVRLRKVIESVVDERLAQVE